jgi:MFS family permease
MCSILKSNFAAPHTQERALIFVAAFLRSLGIGLLGVILGIYLYRVGYSSLQIGAVVGTGLAGSACATAFLSFAADRLGRKRSLLLLSILSAAGGVALASVSSVPFFVLLVVAFVGMLNGTGTDRSPSFAIEQAIIPGLAPDSARTWNLAFYNALIDGGGALGALAAGIPLLLQHRAGLGVFTAYKILFLGYAGLSLAIAAIYLFLSSAVEVSRQNIATGQPILSETKKVLTKLTALFSLDAFGGGFLTDALVAYWFFRRFGIAEQDLGLVFFAVHILNAVSHLGAAWLAARIGLVNTMVFTHLPSSLFLIAVPFAPSFKWAVLLFFCREALVEMDVPTRQSYVAAMVRPSERTFAAGITNLARNVFWAVGSATAGILMQTVTFSAPLIVGGGAKVLYDVLLFRSFRKVRPPEEQQLASRG